ncbi:MAG: putative sigma regulatory protein MucB/RseB [Verrucomicrobiaceae bacterium]|nr:putative sigma regulatory protein MucB/RseB [Verrucomicrobiaceae bacterium]
MTRLLVLFLFASLCSLPLVSRAEEAARALPAAEDLLKLVRISYTLNNSRLTGRLRDNESGKEEPFDLNMSQQSVRFRFVNPPQIVNLDLTTTPATLRDVKPGGSEEVPASMYSERVRGFDLTYEDLSMSFLYWTKAEVLGEESLGTFSGQKAWKVRVTTPDNKGPYGTVDIWVHQGSGGMAKMEGWDRKGNKIKHFEIRSIQKVGDNTVPKEIRVDTLAPGSSKKTGSTYMTFDKPIKN